MGTENLQNDEQDFDAAFSNASDELDGTVQEEHAGEELPADEELQAEAGEEGSDDEPEAEQSNTDSDDDQGEGSGEPVDWQARAEEWQQKYRSDEGRVSAYQRQAEELKQKNAELEQKLQSFQSAGQTDNNPPPPKAGEQGQPSKEDDQRWQEFLEDFSEVAKYVDQKLNAANQEREQLMTQLGQVQQQVEPIAQAHYEQMQRDHFAAIDAAVPGWREFVTAPEFNEWLQQQPSQVQGIREQGSTNDVVWLFNQYQAANARSAQAEQIQSKRRARVQSAATVSSRRNSVDLEGEGRDFDSAFAYAAKKLDAQRRR